MSRQLMKNIFAFSILFLFLLAFLGMISIICSYGSWWIIIGIVLGICGGWSFVSVLRIFVIQVVETGKI